MVGEFEREEKILDICSGKSKGPFFIGSINGKILNKKDLLCRGLFLLCSFIGNS
jgi:hypothetical protein